MSYRIFLLSCMVGLFTYGTAAQMRIDFQGPVTFVLKINGHGVNQFPCHRIGFDWETKDKKFQLVTLLSNGDSLTQALNYKSGYHQQYELQQIKNVWKWQLSGENTWLLDTTQYAEIVTLDPIYSGSKLCDAPMGEEQWSVFSGEVQSNLLSAQKLQTISMLSAGSCCSVEQWTKLMNQFELEDDKLAFLNAIKTRIYDWDNRMILADSFLVERNRNKALQLLSL